MAGFSFMKSYSFLKLLVGFTAAAFAEQDLIGQRFANPLTSQPAPTVKQFQELDKLFLFAQ
jgi:hypothetical protein